MQNGEKRIGSYREAVGGRGMGVGRGVGWGVWGYPRGDRKFLAYVVFEYVHPPDEYRCRY